MARDERETSRIFAEEDAVVSVQSFLHELMEEKGISRADLARAMGVSRARVTQIFSDECSNLTLRLLARAMFALDEQLVVSSSRRVKADLAKMAPEIFRKKICSARSPWVEIESDEKTDPLFAFGANDNVFGGLDYLRQERASYGMAA